MTTNSLCEGVVFMCLVVLQFLRYFFKYLNGCHKKMKQKTMDINNKQADFSWMLERSCHGKN